MWKEVAGFDSKAQDGHLAGGIEENQEEPQSG
jgi:hypothetical protein